MAWVNVNDRLPVRKRFDGYTNDRYFYEEIMVCGIHKDGTKFIDEFMFVSDMSECLFISNIDGYPEDKKHAWLRIKWYSEEYAEPYYEYHEEDQNEIMYWFEWDWPAELNDIKEAL